jgi:hypothetical protein
LRPLQVIRIISSGPAWLTLTIGVLGLMLALISLGWQVMMFYWSGSRVRLQTKLGFFVVADISERDLSQAVTGWETGRRQLTGDGGLAYARWLWSHQKKAAA